MYRITESQIEQFAIDLLERRDYQYNHCMERAGLEPAPTENALHIEYSLFAQNARADLEPAPTKSAINIAYLTHAPAEIKTISEIVLNLKIFFVDENRVAA